MSAEGRRAEVDALEIRQFRYGGDNLGYLVHGRREALAVDGGAVDEILAWLDRRGLALVGITQTHAHPDHVCGNAALGQATGAPRIAGDRLLRQGGIAIDGCFVAALATPGHTDDALVFAPPGALLTGDTLFNGTVGNCFSGDLGAFYDSLRRLMAYPPETVIYAGHDYVAAAMAFARHLEPDNPHIAPYLARHDPNHVRSTLAEELRVNPHLRFDDPAMIALLRRRGIAGRDSRERWEALMNLE
jgi:hydroxyacylglutathione hydrolase